VKTTLPAFAVIAAVLLVLALLVTACTSIPGPESSRKATAVTTPPYPVVTGTPAPVAVKTTRMTLAPRTTVPIPVTTGYESKTCSEQGGTEVIYGQQCTGTYLAATDTFSCCSSKPARAGTGNATVTVTPFNLTVNLDDSPGSIGP
jgi:hypothetical protein